MNTRNLFRKIAAALSLALMTGFISAVMPTAQAQTTNGFFSYIFDPVGVATAFLGTDTKTDDDAVLATETWTGGDNNDGNWSSNGNWSGAGGAGADDSLVFPQSASRKLNVNNFAVNTSFNSLNFTGGSYDISGNQIFLVNGIDVNIPPASGAGPNFEPNIILGGNQTWDFQTAGTNIRGVVNLNNRNLTVITSSTGSVSMFNTINGTGTITKGGEGRMFVVGNGNGFGTTSINNGTAVVLGSLGNILFTGSGTVAGTGSVGSISGGGGTIAPGHPLAAIKTGILTATGNVTLISAGGATVEMKINGPVAGTDYDRLVVNGDVNLGGVADLVVTRPLGFVAAVGQQFTVLQTTGIGHTISGQFAQGNSIFVGGRLFSITYTSTAVTLTAQQTTYTWDGGDAFDNWSSGQNWITEASPVSGQGDILVFPTGVTDRVAHNDLPNGSSFHSMVITGNNYNITGGTVNGGITLTNGILENAPVGQGSGINTNITLAQAQTFTANGLGNGNSPISFGLQINSTTALDLNGFPLTIDGTGRQIYSCPIVGAGGIIKNGTGGVKATGTNTFTGGIQINNGVFEVSGTTPGTITLNGGTLGGNGTTGPVTGTGGIAPGALAGTAFNIFATLNVNGNVNLGAGSTYFEQLGGQTISHDILNVTGAVNLGAGTSSLNGSILNGFVPTPGQQFTIIQATGGVTGTFAQGNTITFGGTTFTITYNANSVILTAQSPTSAGVDVTGRVLTSAEGRGVRGAVVTLTDASGLARNVLTGSGGQYKFEDVPPGETYLISVRSRRFSFEPRILQVFDTVADFDLVALQ